MILRPPAMPLDPRVRRYWASLGALVAAGLAVAVVVGAVICAVADAGTAAVLVGVLGGLVAVVVGVLAVAVAPRVEYEHTRYEVTELGLYVARGWLWRRWQVVPHARVQTVDTRAGPLLRAFGLVQVVVTTASSEGGTSIEGLDPRTADALVLDLARLAGIEEGA